MDKRNCGRGRQGKLEEKGAKRSQKENTGTISSAENEINRATVKFGEPHCISCALTIEMFARADKFSQNFHFKNVGLSDLTENRADRK